MSRTGCVLRAMATGLIATGLVLGSMTSALADAGAEEDRSSALGDFGACMLSQQHGSVVFLIDQSGSLRRTDPAKDRVKAGEYLVKRFESFASKTGVELDIRVAGFSSNYAPQSEWTTLSQATSGAVASSVEAVGNDIRDYDTDYWTALEYARQDLDGHGGKAGACKAIVWVTDGDFDVDPRDSSDARSRFGNEKPYAPGVPLDNEQDVAKAVAAGKSDMCRNTGLADQLRSSGITLLGIGLTQGNPDFSFVKSVILGGGANAKVNGVIQCGNQSSPRGAFYSVNDLDSLYMAFDSISTPGQTTSSQKVGICQGSLCSDKEVTFVLDDSIGAVHVMASSDRDGLDAYLNLPGDGKSLKLASGTSGDAGSADITYSWLTGRTLEFDLDPSKVRTWTGVWRIQFVDNTSRSEKDSVHVNLHLSSSSFVHWVGLADTELHTGDKLAGVKLEALSGVGGKRIDLNTLRGTVEMRVSISDESGKITTLLDSADKAALDSPVTLDLAGVATGPATVSTSLQITTASASLSDGTEVAGTTLTPTVTTTEVTVAPPVDFPHVPGTVDFGTLEGGLSVEAEAQVSGPGCVWIEPGGLTLTGAPSGAGEIAVTSTADESGECVSVSDGARGTLPLTLSVTDSANGALTGTIAVNLAPEGHPEKAQTIAVPFTADMRKPLNAPLAWATFIAAVLLGVGIPVVALYLFKFLTAKIPKGDLVSTVVPVIIPNDAYKEAEITVTSRDLVVTSLGKATRQVTIGGYEFRSRLGLSPAQPGWVELSADAPSISSAAPGTRAAHAVLPLGFRGHWIAVLDRQDSPRSVNLIVVSASSDTAAVERILADARSRVADATRSVQDQLASTHDDGAQVEGQEPTDGSAFASAFTEDDGGIGFSSGDDGTSLYGDFGSSADKDSQW